MGKDRVAYSLLEVLIGLAILLLILLFLIPALLGIFKEEKKQEVLSFKERELINLANELYSKNFNDPCLTKGLHCENDSCCSDYDNDLRYKVEDVNSNLKRIELFLKDFHLKLILYKGNWK